MSKLKSIFLVFFTLFLSFNNLKNNPHVTPAMKSRIEPHLLAQDHFLMKAMDHIFMHHRVTASDQALEEAGFSILFSQPRSKIRVLRHSKLPNHLIKLTLDTNTNIKKRHHDWEWLVNRCIGSKKVRGIIKKNQLKQVVVPKKWLYVLPANPAPLLSTHRKIVVLLAEEIKLVDKQTNKRKWREEMTKEHLSDLFKIMSYGGASSWRPDNVWFTEDNKLALIDTEYPGREAHYTGVKQYLSPENQVYWDKLMEKYKKN